MVMVAKQPWSGRMEKHIYSKEEITAMVDFARKLGSSQKEIWDEVGKRPHTHVESGMGAFCYACGMPKHDDWYWEDGQANII